MPKGLGLLCFLSDAQAGFSFLLNVSGKLYTATRVSLKDVGANARALQLHCLNGLKPFEGCGCKRMCMSTAHVGKIGVCPCASEAIYPVTKVSRGSGRFSERITQRAILSFYTTHKLWPRGIVEEMSCKQLWSLKVAKALCRLAASLKWCCQHMIHGFSQCKLGIASGQPLRLFASGA